MIVKTREDEDPMHALNRGFYVTTLLAMVGFYVAVHQLLGNNLWFFAAGICNALSLQFLNNALAVGDVVAVVPVVSATPVFTLLLGVLFFGRESITWRTVATIALIVPGVILVALHTAG